MISQNKVDSASVKTNSSDNSTIKFNMKNDEEVRLNARAGYEIAKVFKEAGISFRKLVPAHVDLMIRKMFHLGPTGPHYCLEILLTGDDANHKKIIDNVKDQFLMMPQYVLVNDKTYQLDRATIVHRFLFKPSVIGA